MAEPLPGAQVARDLGVPLGQLYSWLKRGLIKNYKEGGYPEGKGLLVDPNEARVVWMSSKKTRGPRKVREPREARGSKAVRDDRDLVRAEPARTKRLKTGTLISMDSGQDARAEFNPRKGPHFTIGQVLGSTGRLTYVDQGKHRTHYTGVQVDNIVFSTDRLALMMAKGIARIEKPMFVLGMVLLAFVVEGKMELAESLEAWMIKNGLDVVVPEIVDVASDEAEEAELAITDTDEE